MEKKKLPIGIDIFEKLRSENFYYVDKTGILRELLQNWGEVNLFTRPRRFGKTLVMSMLESFFLLLESQRLSQHDKMSYQRLLDDKMDEAFFCSGLKKLSELLEKHYGTKVILLIDEYDVPLARRMKMAITSR